jgi:hypothetical protein
MFERFFGKNKPVDKTANTPSIIGLRLGGSFEVDALLLRLIESEFVVEHVAPTQIIQAVGLVDMDGTLIYRFYTDDEAFLQVIAEGGSADHNVVDVKLFHFYDTQDIASKSAWDELLNHQIGQPEYALEGHHYQRVWTAAGDYHNPVHMAEKTYDDEGDISETDQFTMLFERPLSNGSTESLFLSAEEKVVENNLERCLVISTGMTLTPSQITIHG